MKFFKNRFVALVLCVLTVLVSTIVSTNAKLGRAADDISDGFYLGVTYSGYKHPAVADQLENICGAADGLASVLSSYDIDVVSMKQNSGELMDMLNQRTSAYNEVYDKYRELLGDIESVKLELASVELSERDASGTEQYLSTVSSASSVISDSGYNDSVREFSRSYLERFPSKLFAELAGVYAPELFA